MIPDRAPPDGTTVESRVARARAGLLSRRDVLRRATLLLGGAVAAEALLAGVARAVGRPEGPRRRPGRRHQHARPPLQHRDPRHRRLLATCSIPDLAAYGTPRRRVPARRGLRPGGDHAAARPGRGACRGPGDPRKHPRRTPDRGRLRARHAHRAAAAREVPAAASAGKPPPAVGPGRPSGRRAGRLRARLRPARRRPGATPAIRGGARRARRAMREARWPWQR